VELDAGTELDATEYAKVAGVELVGGIDFGSGRGRGTPAQSVPRATSGVGAGERTSCKQGQCGPAESILSKRSPSRVSRGAQHRACRYGMRMSG
jgi:hypothetical protein